MDKFDRRNFFGGNAEKIINGDLEGFKKVDFDKAVQDAKNRIDKMKQIKGLVKVRAKATSYGSLKPTFGRWLRSALQSTNTEISVLASRTFIKECNIKGMLLHRRSPTLDEANMITRYLGFKLWEVLKEIDEGEDK